jgi:hypothetical protein
MSRARNNSQGMYDQVQYLNGGQLAGFRNRLLNGDMRVAQRGASGTLSSTPSYLSVDRWQAVQYPTAAGIFSQVQIQQQGFLYAAKLGRTSGSTNTSYLYLVQALESLNSVSLAGQTVTLSFYAKAGANFSSSGNNVTVQLYTGTGFDQSAASIGAWTGNAIPINTTQAITTTLTRYSFTTTLAGTISQVAPFISYVPTGTAGADDNLYITGIQLEVGSFATPFEHRPFGTELAMCQRYFYQAPVNASPCTGPVNGISITFDFPATMRAVPSLIHGLTDAAFNGGGPGTNQWAIVNPGVAYATKSAGTLTPSLTLTQSSGTISFYGMTLSVVGAVTSTGLGTAQYAQFSAEL